jgi:hypothetical protein
MKTFYNWLPLFAWAALMLLGSLASPPTCEDLRGPENCYTAR